MIMREAGQVTPASQTAGSAGEGLCCHESPGSSMPASTPPGGPWPGGQRLPAPSASRGQRHIMGRLVKEISTKLSAILPGMSENLQRAPKVISSSPFHLIHVLSQCSASSSYGLPGSRGETCSN